MSKARLQLDVIIESDDTNPEVEYGTNAYELAEAMADWFFDSGRNYVDFVDLDVRDFRITLVEDDDE